MAQWITRLTTDQEIPGSTPGRFGYLLVLLRLLNRDLFDRMRQSQSKRNRPGLQDRLAFPELGREILLDNYKWVH